MFKVATEDEIDSLVRKTVDEYKKEVLKVLSDRYQPSQKIPREKVEEILNKTYDSEIENYFFEDENIKLKKEIKELKKLKDEIKGHEGYISDYLADMEYDD